MVGVLHLESLDVTLSTSHSLHWISQLLVFSRQGLPVYPKLALNFWSPCLG